jgi:hypothetical protein
MLPPLTGGYYWLPTPSTAGTISWGLLTCHDLGLWDCISHREMWPTVLEFLATAWGNAPEALRRRLGDHYYGLPRGRITSSRGRYLIVHGQDAPIPDWEAGIIDRFRLAGLDVRDLSNEHESVVLADVLSVEEALGVTLGRPGSWIGCPPVRASQRGREGPGIPNEIG